VTVGTMEKVITEDAEPIEQATPKMLIEGMDPAELIMTKNVRPVELDAEFIASIQENGLFQPIIATPFEGKYAIILGNRRAAGSIKAGQTVDVIVRSDLSEDAARIVAQLIENMHRQEMRPSEVAAACAQLAIDLGLSEEQIAKKLGKDRKDVRASIALHEMPKAARDAADAGQMDIETAMEAGLRAQGGGAQAGAGRGEGRADCAAAQGGHSDHPQAGQHGLWLTRVGDLLAADQGGWPPDGRGARELPGARLLLREQHLQRPHGALRLP